MGAADNRWKATEEPIDNAISTADAKAFLRVDTSADDSVIADCIKAAEDYCQQEMGLALMDQEITVKIDGFPDVRYLYLPMSNLLSVTSVSYIDSNGDTQAYTDYTADTYSTPGRILNNAIVWPQTKDVANAVTIVYRAGFKAYETGLTNPVPNAVRQAMLMLITHFYDHRNGVMIGAGYVTEELALSVTALLAKYRRMGV